MYPVEGGEAGLSNLSQDVSWLCGLRTQTGIVANIGYPTFRLCLLAIELQTWFDPANTVTAPSSDNRVLGAGRKSATGLPLLKTRAKCRVPHQTAPAPIAENACQSR